MGASLVDVWAWSNTAPATLSSLSANGIGFAAFTDASRNSPVQVAALDTSGDGIADVILAGQGPGGTTGQIRVFDITDVLPFEVSPLPPLLPLTVPGSYPEPDFIATIKNPSPVLPPVVAAGESHAVAEVWHNDASPCDVNGLDGVTPLDALLLVNYLDSPPNSPPAVSPAYYDVGGGPNGEGDGQVTPLDVIFVVNHINSPPQGAVGEGESATTPRPHPPSTCRSYWPDLTRQRWGLTGWTPNHRFLRRRWARQIAVRRSSGACRTPGLAPWSTTVCCHPLVLTRIPWIWTPTSWNSRRCCLTSWWISHASGTGRPERTKGNCFPVAANGPRSPIDGLGRANGTLLGQESWLKPPR